MSRATARAASRPTHRVLIRESLPREHGFEPLAVEGALPSELSGTLYRNGPGLFELFGRRYDHPFEGDGAITAVRFRGGQAHGAARVTETAGLVREREAGRMLYGFSAPWSRRVRSALRGEGKNTANTNVIAWQGKLLALMEAGQPTELSPETLDIVGTTDLGAIVAGGAFSAHPHRVAARRASYNFGLRYGRENWLDLYELPDEGAARRLGGVRLPYSPMLHDFIATRDHLVFFIAPVRVKVMRALTMTGPFRKLFEWAPELGTEVVVVPIDAPDDHVRFSVPAFFQWHFANAFERDGKLVVDFVRYDDFSSFEAIASDLDIETTGPGKFHRVVVDAARERLDDEQVIDVSCEFPRVHPALEGGGYRYAWLMTQNGRGVGRLDVESGELVEHDLGAGGFASEPVFVPRTPEIAAPGGALDPGAEVDGWALSLVYDADRHKSHLAVFDGRRPADGPIARVWFDHHIPITFHGNWLPA